jgi:SagB-type dehydrogenase family enzyme
VLDLAAHPVSPDELAERAATERSIIDVLAGAGILVPADGAPPPAHWSPHELIVQRMAGGGGTRPGLDPATMPAMRKGSWSAKVIDLPDPAVPAVGLAAALEGRRSRRSFDTAPLELPELGSVLIGAAGVQRADPADGVSYRPHASGGGRHPLEITVVANRVRGLEPGVYWFDAFDRTLHERDVDLRVADEVADELGAALGLGEPCDAPAFLLVTAVFARTLWKYEGIGLGLVYRDAGSLLQTLHLVATGLALAGSPAQLRRELEFSRWLGLDPSEESLVGCFVLGRPDR